MKLIFCVNREDDIYKIKNNILYLQELQLLQYERIDSNLSEKEKLLFYSVQNNLKEFAEKLAPSDLFNQVEILNLYV